jgi:acetyl esterase/lipase
MEMGSVSVTKDLPYGPDPRHRLDLYRPNAKVAGVVVDIHGGGWWTGDKSSELALAGTLSEAGYLVAVPNYRLADGAARKNLYPAQVDDVGAVLGWLTGTGLAPDPSRIGVVGTSSGGNLAVEMAVRHGVPAVSWSGLLDLDGFVARHPGVIPRRADVSGGPGAIDQGGPDDRYYMWLVRNLLGGDLKRAAEATPIHRVGPSTGPIYLANSLAELVPAGEPVALASALVGAGLPVEVAILPGSRHAEGYAADVTAPTLAFLARYLR